MPRNAKDIKFIPLILRCFSGIDQLLEILSYSQAKIHFRNCDQIQVNDSSNNFKAPTLKGSSLQRQLVEDN